VIITPTFTANFDTNFGANATAAKAAWIAAAQVFTTNFSDSININITVDAVAGTGVFGHSNTSLLSISYAELLALVSANAATLDDQISLGSGGSISAADPTNGTGTWWLARSQAKALGFIPDDMAQDGVTTFGAGYSFTFSGGITAGTYDFQGVAAHEISEVMGRLGLSGGNNSYSLIDMFSYTGPGTRGLRAGPGNNFSIDNGTTLLKLWNDPTVNGLDSRDWAPGTNDAFNQFSGSGVVNGVSAVDLQLMDVIGYTLNVGLVVTAGGGDIALVRQTPGWSTIPIAFSNGSGGWNITNGAAPDFIPSWANQPGVRVVTGDFNGNGLTDIALVRQTPGWSTIPIAFSNGSGGWNITNGAAPDFIPSWANQPGVQLFQGKFH